MEGTLKFLLLLWYSMPDLRSVWVVTIALPATLSSVSYRWAFISTFKITAMNNNECSFIRRRTSVRNDAQTMTFARRYKKTRSVTCAADANPMRKSAQSQQIARSAVPPRFIWIWKCEGLWIRILSGDANSPPLFPQMRVWRVPGGFSVAVQTLIRWRVGHTHTLTHTFTQCCYDFLHALLLWSDCSSYAAAHLAAAPAREVRFGWVWLSIVTLSLDVQRVSLFLPCHGL